ncbi:MAG: hypothetical protein ACOYJV_00135 [Aminivibrio sp.]|jgi:hypothetical protein
MKKAFHNHKGKVYATLENGVLRKSERQKDRLKVTGGRAHAIDADLLSEAIGAGGRVLQIRERGLAGEVRIFQIQLEDIRRYGRRLTLAGVARVTVPLERCKLLQGPEEPWRLLARQEHIEAEERREETEAVQGDQLQLFEISPSEIRQGYEQGTFPRQRAAP